MTYSPTYEECKKRAESQATKIAEYLGDRRSDDISRNDMLRAPGIPYYKIGKCPMVVNKRKEFTMPQGDKSSYTDKQKRQAQHIEEGYKEKGLSTKEAERRAWSTVNKESGGGKKSGSGRSKSKH